MKVNYYWEIFENALCQNNLEIIHFKKKKALLHVNRKLAMLKTVFTAGRIVAGITCLLSDIY